MIKHRALLACSRTAFVIQILLIASGSAQRPTGTFQITVRDVSTHFAVQADVHFHGPENLTVQADTEGHLKPRLAPGEYQMEISAPGYKAMKTHYRVSAGRNQMGIEVEPESLPASENAAVIRSQIRPGFTLFHGFTVDEHTGHPISGVEISFAHAKVHVLSDANGHYALLVPTPQPEIPGGMGVDTLRFTKAGYKTLVFQNLGVGGDDMTRCQDMEMGKGVIRTDATHKLLRR